MSNFFLFGALLFTTVLSETPCLDHQDEATCNSQASTSCVWDTASNTCGCSYQIGYDILFAIDTSGSVGLESFQLLKAFLNLFINDLDPATSKIGFVMFATNVNFTRDVSVWDTATMSDYVNGLYWTAGFTNTPGALDVAVQEFTGVRNASSYVPDANRRKMLMMITDGNPCFRDAQGIGRCPYDLCMEDTYAEDLNAANVRTVVIGVGSGLVYQYIGCLAHDPDDFIPVSSYSPTALGGASVDMSYCPLRKNLAITEVRASNKDRGNKPGNGRYTRFVEVYNTGDAFTLDQVIVAGLVNIVSGTQFSSSITLMQDSYLVFYDASGGVLPSTVSCHLCGTDCDLTSCGIAGDPATTDQCFCNNAIYVACGSSTSANCTSESTNGAYDMCSVCLFNDDMDKTNWEMSLSDSFGLELIDDVVYDATSWMEAGDRHSYKLTDIALNNDDGANWFESCDAFGTPGSGPFSCVTRTSPTTATMNPTADPTRPSGAPSSSPSNPPTVPSAAPSGSPVVPSTAPTDSPTKTTESPTQSPSAQPTGMTSAPTLFPSMAPESAAPTISPTNKPSRHPTSTPTASSRSPSKTPSTSPSGSPSETLSFMPTLVPSFPPTIEDICLDNADSDTCFGTISECAKSQSAQLTASDLESSSDRYCSVCSYSLDLSSRSASCHCQTLDKSVVSGTYLNSAIRNEKLLEAVVRHCFPDAQCSSSANVMVSFGIFTRCECDTLQCDGYSGYSTGLSTTSSIDSSIISSESSCWNVNVLVLISLVFLRVVV